MSDNQFGSGSAITSSFLPLLNLSVGFFKTSCTALIATIAFLTANENLQN